MVIGVVEALSDAEIKISAPVVANADTIASILVMGFKFRLNHWRSPITALGRVYDETRNQPEGMIAGFERVGTLVRVIASPGALGLRAVIISLRENLDANFLLSRELQRTFASSANDLIGSRSVETLIDWFEYRVVALQVDGTVVPIFTIAPCAAIQARRHTAD